MIKDITKIKNLKGKKVFLRADFNVPINNGKVLDDNRISESLPTIKYLISKKAKIIIGSHLGRPSKNGDKETSLAPVVKELKKLLKININLSPEVVGSKSKKLAEVLGDGEILVLENLRWEKGEETNDSKFAKKLACLAEIYVNDAFAVSHRSHASVEAITRYLPSCGGFLIQKEIENLSKIIKNQKRPFIIIIGGAKIADKIGVIDNLAGKVDRFLIGGAMGNTFLASRGNEMSKSVYEDKVLDTASGYLSKYQNKIMLPVDNLKTEVEGGFSYMDIGSVTIKNYQAIIKNAKTVFWNGNLGYSEEKEFANGTNEIAKAIAQNRSCFSVIAGGDTVSVINKLKLNNRFSFISTGGGAALEFLAGKKLPGIEALR